MSGNHGALPHIHTSVVSALDARVKILVFVSMCVLAVLTPLGHWPVFAAFALVLALYGWIGKVAATDVVRRLLIAAPFVLFVLLFVPFAKPDFARNEYWVLVGPLRLSSGGLKTVAEVGLKAGICTGALTMLAFTTPFEQMLRGFEQLRVPGVLVHTVSLCWRYLFTFRDELQRMLRARDARAWRGRWLWQVAVFGRIIGLLFLRAYERAERVYQAMLARGYADKPPATDRRFDLRDAAFLAGGVIVLATSRAMPWLMR